MKLFKKAKQFSEAFNKIVVVVFVAFISNATQSAVLSDSSAKAAETTGIHFELKQVIFPDSAFLSKDELAHIAAAYTGKQVGLEEINQLVSDVNALYAEKKIMTALAVLSNQKIRDGQVQIDLIEARFGQADVQSTYTNADFILAQLKLKQDQILDLNQTDLLITRFNRTHEVQISAEVKPGTDSGLTDLVLHVEEPNQYQLKLFADNESAPSLGRDEAGINASAAGLLGRADVLALMLSKSSGATNIDANYGVGVGSHDTTFNTVFTKNNIAILSGSYSAIDITGITDKTSVGLDQPWLADADWLLATDLIVARSNSKNFSVTKLVSQFDIDILSANFSASRKAESYQWSSLLQTDYGRAVAENDTRNDYLVYSGNLTGLKSLDADDYLTARANGQFSKNRQLPPSALIQVGGQATVRGYDTGLLTGSDGYALSAEAHHLVTDGLDGYVFADHGLVANPDQQKSKITGFGLGANWTWKTLSVKMDYGHAKHLVHADEYKNRLELRIEGQIF